MPLVVQAKNEPNAVYFGYAIARDGGEAETMRIDLDSKTSTATRVVAPFDRARFDVFDELPLNLSPVRTSLTGVRLARPVPYLFKIPYEGRGPGIALVPSLMGSESLVWTGRGPLLTRRVINSQGFEKSSLKTFLHPNGGLLACAFQDKRGTRVWLFRIKQDNH